MYINFLLKLCLNCFSVLKFVYDLQFPIIFCAYWHISAFLFFAKGEQRLAPKMQAKTQTCVIFARLPDSCVGFLVLVVPASVLLTVTQAMQARRRRRTLASPKAKGVQWEISSRRGYEYSRLLCCFTYLVETLKFLILSVFLRRRRKKANESNTIAEGKPSAEATGIWNLSLLLSSLVPNIERR